MTQNLAEKKMTINIGPQHPSTHGVLRLVLELEGEIISSAEPVIGYLHRGMEKMAESRSYVQYLPLVDRIDYLSGFFNSASYCYAVEKLAKIEVPRYAEYIRLITMEFNRIASHLLWLGTFLLDLGATSPLFYCFRDREEILKLFEDLTGQRMMYNFYCFGGIKKDLPADWTAQAIKLLNKLPQLFDEYEALITKNPIFLDRVKNIGVLSAEFAINYGITGPNLRASGVDFDLRKSQPYSVYNEIDFKVCTAQNGDCFDRYAVRLAEMRECVSILKQAISNLKEINKKELYYKKVNMLAFKPEKSETTSLVESSRGLTACYLVCDASTKPYRLKWRTPSFSAVSVMPALLKNRPYADLMAILGSLDIVLPEVDR